MNKEIVLNLPGFTAKASLEKSAQYSKQNANNAYHQTGQGVVASLIFDQDDCFRLCRNSCGRNRSCLAECFYFCYG